VNSTAGALTFGAGVADGASTLKYSSQVITVSAGSYTLRESNIAGYSEGTWSCTGATPSNTSINLGAVTVPLATAVVCTITNNDDPGTIVIVKQTTGANGTFTFATTGPAATALPNPISITTTGTPGTGSQTFNNRNAGTYTVDENDLAGFVLTDLGCIESGGASVANTTVVGPPSGVATIRLEVGETVTCTYVNSGALTTRTQGFWSTHMSITNVVWFGGTLNGTTFAGVADKTLCGRAIDDIGELLGGFWSNIARTSTNGQRSELDRARMRLLQQLLAAILNNAAFGSAPSGTTIDQAKTAFCGTDITAIQQAAAAMAAFNESGDSGTFTPGASANGKQAKDAANIAFWDVLPAG
jgi:hypothetical protein